MEQTEFFERVLRETPVFAGLDDDRIATIAGCAKNMRYPAAEKIYGEGDHADQFLILREGHVAIDMQTLHRGILTVQTVGPGEVLGWSWLFPPYEWHYDARAVEDTRAIALDARCLRGKCQQDPALGFELMKRFSTVMLSRLEATRMQLLDIYDMTASASK
jgi:CRP-like cAMP-binding protein